MNAPAQPTADPALVETWVRGWALSRGVAPPTPAYGGLRVDVGLPDQQARYVFARAGDGFAQAARSIVEPHVFIKAFAPPEAVQRRLVAGWRISAVNLMMTTDGLGLADMRLPPEYRLERDDLQRGHLVRLLTPHGELAASGRAFVIGATAVFDQIETHPDHRRRGLGRVVMSALGAAATRTGADHGLLVATADGEALYTTMGWRSQWPLTSAVRA
jgi:GNAT superfamily N-acetyltransferase